VITSLGYFKRDKLQFSVVLRLASWEKPSIAQKFHLIAVPPVQFISLLALPDTTDRNQKIH